MRAQRRPENTMSEQLQTPTIVNAVPITSLLATQFQKLETLEPIASTGAVTRAVGLVVESRGPAVSVGDLCYLVGREREERFPLELIGFPEATLLSMPLVRMSLF